MTKKATKKIDGDLKRQFLGNQNLLKPTNTRYQTTDVSQGSIPWYGGEYFMLKTQDKHYLCCQKVARASGHSSTEWRFGSERLRYLVASLQT